jgi:fibronectin type 3 domain-containing protein
MKRGEYPRVKHGTGRRSTAGHVSSPIQLVHIALCGLALLVLVPEARAQVENVELVGQIGGSCYTVHVVGHYAYIGEGYSLRILDVSNPSSPVPLGRVRLPGVRESGGVAGSIHVSAGLAYVGVGDGGLQIIDVTNPGAPTPRGSCFTSGQASGVHMLSGLAYVANGMSGLQIVDVSSPSAPTLRGSCDTPGQATSVYVSGSLAYVADWTSGLQIIDVTNPSSPTLRGSYNTSGEAGGVCVSGGLAYVADGTSGLQIVDVSNPSAPTLRGSYDTPGVAWGVYVAGGLAYVADMGGLQIIDVTNPTSPTLRASYDTPGCASGVFVLSGLAYVADRESGLQIIDVSNPTAPTLRGFYDTLGYARGAYVSGGLAYVANGPRGLQIIDVTNPSEPIRRGAYNTPYYHSGYPYYDAYEVYVSADLAYMADGYSGLQIIDVTNPSSPTLRSSCRPDYAWGVYVSGSLAYTAGINTLQIIDVTDPSAPSVRGQYNAYPGAPWDVYVSGGLAYVAAGLSGLLIVDVANPSAPTLRGSYNTPGATCGVYVSGNVAYVADEGGGLQVVDVRNPSAPTLRGSYDTLGDACGVYTSGSLAYVATGVSGLQIIDVSNPSAPSLRGQYITGGYASGVHVSGGLAYVAAGPCGLWILRYMGSGAPPEAPSSLTATAVSSSRVNLSWTDNSNNEQGFKIERATGSLGTWSQINAVGTNVDDYADTGLLPNTFYRYRVKAYNAWGDSFFSNEANARTLNTTPTAPSNLTASAVSPRQINLSWRDNSNNEQGFKIERKTGVSGTWSQMATVGANVTTYRDTAVLANTGYCYRVRAYNAAGNSQYSNEASTSFVIDLAVLSLSIPGTPRTGVTMPVYVAVRNNGSQRQAIVKVRLYSDGRSKDDIPSFPLDAGSSTTVHVEGWAPLHEGQHTVSAVVDAVSGEANTENNRKSITINVQPLTVAPVPKIERIAVVQAVEGVRHWVSGKSTIVRVYLSPLPKSDKNEYGVEVTLRMKKPGDSVIQTVGTKRFDWKTTYTATERANLANTANFYFPSKSGEDGWDLSLPQSGTHTFSVATRLGSGSDQRTTYATFESTRNLNFLVVPFEVFDIGAGVRYPAPDLPNVRGNDFRILARSYPLSDPAVATESFEWLIMVPPLVGDYVKGEFLKSATLLHTESVRKMVEDYWHADFAVGFVPALYGIREFGWSHPSGPLPIEKSVVAQAKPNFTAHTVPHEIGHLYGLGDEYQGGHPSDVNPPPSDDPWGTKVDKYSPVDCVTRSLVVPSRAGNVYSFMSGGGLNDSYYWISPVCFEHLFSKLRTSGSTPRTKSAQRAVLISALLWADDTVMLFDAKPVALDSSTASTGTTHSCALLDAGRHQLARVFFAPDFTVMNPYPLILRMPLPSNAKYVSIKKGTRTLFEKSIGSTSPTVQLLSPNGGNFGTQRIAIRWAANDPDGDSLTCDILGSPDGGSTWLPIALNIQSTNTLLWDTSRARGGNNWKVKVVATDGFHTGQDISDQPFSIATKPPVVVIDYPTSGSVVLEDQEITFWGSASDPEGGTISPSSLLWRSSLSGTLYQGDRFRRKLPPGTHVISLEAKDPENKVSKAYCAIAVKVDSDHDRMADDWERQHGLIVGVDDSLCDPDHDGLVNADEYFYRTDPHNPDSDGDGFTDGEEIAAGTDPNNPRDHPSRRAGVRPWWKSLP